MRHAFDSNQGNRDSLEDLVCVLLVVPEAAVSWGRESATQGPGIASRTVPNAEDVEIRLNIEWTPSSRIVAQLPTSC